MANSKSRKGRSANFAGQSPAANVIRGRSQAEEPTFREKPVRSATSRHALATLIQKEAKDIGELAEMMETDYQVKFAQAIVASNISAITVEVKATGNDPRAKLLADQMQKLWTIHLSEMLECFGRGRSAFEKVWDYNRDANVHFIRKLEHLPYKQTEMMLEPDTGKFIGIALKYNEKGREPKTIQQASAGGSEAGNGSRNQKILEIPQPNSWWLALDATATHPHGKSRHNGAPYRVYQERQQALRLRRLFLQKMVLMGGVAHVPDQITLENGQSLDTFAEMARAHDDRLSGGMMILSNKKDADGDYEFSIDEQPSTLSPEPIDTHIDGLDQEQLQAYDIPPKVAVEGDAVGSFAMVSIQRLILDALVEHILSQMERSFQRYVIDKVVQTNFSDDSGISIKISHEPLLDQSNQIMAQLVETILTSPQLPAIMTSGIVDVMELLKASRIPLLPGAEAAIKKLFQQAAAAAQATAAVGTASATGAAGTPRVPGAPEPAKPPSTPQPTHQSPQQPPQTPANQPSGSTMAGEATDTGCVYLFNPNHGHDGKFTTGTSSPISIFQQKGSVKKLHTYHVVRNENGIHIHHHEEFEKGGRVVKNKNRYFIPIDSKMPVHQWHTLPSTAAHGIVHKSLGRRPSGAHEIAQIKEIEHAIVKARQAQLHPAHEVIPTAELANTFQELTTQRASKGRFIRPSSNPVHQRMRTRYTAHADDVDGCDSAIGNAIRDLKRHADAHGLTSGIHGHADGHMLRFTGPSGEMHVRIGRKQLTANQRFDLPPGTIDIPVSGRPIGETHGKVGTAKGKMEEIKHHHAAIPALA